MFFFPFFSTCACCYISLEVFLPFLPCKLFFQWAGEWSLPHQHVTVSTVLCDHLYCKTPSCSRFSFPLIKNSRDNLNAKKIKQWNMENIWINKNIRTSKKEICITLFTLLLFFPPSLASPPLVNHVNQKHILSITQIK